MRHGRSYRGSDVDALCDALLLPAGLVAADQAHEFLRVHFIAVQVLCCIIGPQLEGTGLPRRSSEGHEPVCTEPMLEVTTDISCQKGQTD